MGKAVEQARFVRSQDLRVAMGHFATGVAVVTAGDGEGRPFGTTANAISSLSLDPPLVLACLRRESQTLRALRETGRFAVNVLGAGQRDLSDRFARPTGAQTWAGVAHRLPDGVPVLDAALATVECLVHELAEGGDHVIVIGRVVAVAHPDPDRHEDPLLFHRGRYAGLAPLEDDHADAEIALPSPLGALRMIALQDEGTVEASVAVLVGDPRNSRGALLHVHRGCLLGDALGSEVCRGRARLHAALAEIAASGRPGVIVYHRDRTIGFGACCLSSGEEVPPTASEQAAVRQAIRRLALDEPVVLDGLAA